MTIGTVARFQQVLPDGKVAPLPFDDPGFSKARPLFSQMAFVMRHDMVARGAYGDEPWRDMAQDDSGLRVLTAGNASLVIDGTPSPLMRAYGYAAAPDGTPRCDVILRTDTLIHDHRSYTYLHEPQGRFHLYQTLSLSPVLRAASDTMLRPGISSSDWLKSLRLQVERPEDLQALCARRDASLQEFNRVSGILATLPDAEKGRFMKDYIACAAQGQSEPECQPPAPPVPVPAPVPALAMAPVAF